MSKNFAQSLKFHRSTKQLSQSELARLVGISQKQISDYELGTSKPRQATLIKILQVLGLDEQEFFNSSRTISYWDSKDNDLIEYVGDNGKKIILPYSYQRNPKNSIVHTHYGDSMLPTLKDGDLLLINTLSPLFYGDLYLVEIQGIRSVYRIYPADDGRLLFEKDNPAYHHFTMNSLEVEILGRVDFRQGFL
ncbi:antitoxin HipB [Moraxella lacunata]|uniref:Antitoxin HipB n=1 Tax=Moraxella lacunata TaxID=477 RepID=A0A378QGI1_MORLA|nr:LexA family transcriptional regulator [Moraxella lacunata]STY99858.1 antitoxin HipB [Moraxella lacunata]